MRYVLPLRGIGLGDTDRVGRKAAVLGELLGAGFTVPAGFAITVDAHLAPPTDLAEQVGRALADLPSGAVAVRSSGIDEDGADRSYAGQYESVLNVEGPDAVLAAVRTCWASAGTERVTAYQAGRAGPARMGVLVQVMVDAAAAGVAFSTNPVTGDAAEVVVGAVPGLADRLVAGEVDAEQWSVRADQAVRVAAAPGTAALDSDAARAVARLARRVAARLGGSQDIEWALDGTTLWLLQARPITGLATETVQPVPITCVAPAGLSTRNRAMDRPWTPLERSIFLPIFSTAVRRIFTYTTGVVPTAHAIGGWVYITVRPDSPQVAASRLEAIAAEVAAGVPQAIVRQWHDSWKHEHDRDIAVLAAADLSGLSDTAFDAHLRQLVDLFGRLHDRYFQLTGAAIAIGAELTKVCAELLGWTPGQAARLRGGLTGDHMGAAIGLGDLARLGASRPAVRDFLATPNPDASLLSDVDPEFGAAFANYVDRYGRRTVSFDLSEPTWAERPEILLALIRAQIDTPYDIAAERAAIEARIRGALAEARVALAGAGPADRARFEAAVAGIVLSSPVRDEKVFQAVALWAQLRYAALELGRRLVDRGTADRPEDALFLELPEALAALSGCADQRSRIRHHRGQHAWALAHPGPDVYGEAPPGAGPLTAPPPTSTVDSGELRGLAASPGRYLGPVRVIHGITDFGKLRHGDVLVCPETTAQWSLLFASVGALVTDRGTMVSHPAILAREYGVPAVVATGTATQTLHDDDLVVVDGAAGVVRPVSGAFLAGTRAGA